MAFKFPLVINTSSRKIEEIAEGQALNLTGNGIAISEDRGIDGQVLKTNGTTVEWGYPSNLYYDNTLRLSATSTGLTINGTLNLGAKSQPDSNSDAGTPGDIKWYADSDGTDGYLYVCVKTDTWKRIPLQNFFP
jgi:hypothetical protein